MTKEATKPAYVNPLVQAFMEEAAGVVKGDAAFQSSREVADALEKLDSASRITPAIIPCLATLADPTANKEGIAIEQLQMAQMATAFRSASTWGTIIMLAGQLALAARFEDAATVNDNAAEEVGGKDSRPHPLLLFDGFKVLGETFGCEYLTPASYALTRKIMHMSRGYKGCIPTLEEIKNRLAAERPSIPEYTDEDIRTAVHFTAVAGDAAEKMLGYHTFILRNILRMDDTGKPITSGAPDDMLNLAHQLGELGWREASSADFPELGVYSYIGAYGTLANSLLGYVPHEKRNSTTRWARAHGDDELGTAKWGASAEEGHARDARELAINMFQKLEPEALAETLNLVAEASRLRLEFWKAAAKRIDELGKKSAEKIPLSPVVYKEPIFDKKALGQLDKVKAEYIVNFAKREMSILLSEEEGLRILRGVEKIEDSLKAELKRMDNVCAKKGYRPESFGDVLSLPELNKAALFFNGARIPYGAEREGQFLRWTKTYGPEDDGKPVFDKLTAVGKKFLHAVISAAEKEFRPPTHVNSPKLRTVACIPEQLAAHELK